MNHTIRKIAGLNESLLKEVKVYGKMIFEVKNLGLHNNTEFSIGDKIVCRRNMDDSFWRGTTPEGLNFGMQWLICDDYTLEYISMPIGVYFKMLKEGPELNLLRILE